MKKILGLDLGTTSIGWALVNEAEHKNETSSIIKLGVRVNPLSTDEQTDFEKGNPLSVNADRTLKRGARRNLQRFKLRRKNLIDILTNYGFINTQSILTENGKQTTFETLALRAKAAKEKIEKEELARILLSINKKRGYKSSRKAKNEEEGTLIDGMAVAKELYESNVTPGQYVYQLLLTKKQYIPDFYRSDLQHEFDTIWNFQKQFYPAILTDELYQKLEGQGLQNSRKLFLAIHQIYTAENKGKREAVKLQHYKWRSNAVNKQLTIEEVAYVLVEVNNNLNKSSGYLGAIGDRSKKLYFNNLTVGEYLYQQIQKNRHTSLKNQVFYRQDYLDEFETIWETQAGYHPELTKELKEDIRDVVIFYQRKLKSQKGLISFCELEKKEIEIVTGGKTKKKTIGPRVVPKSSPIFQEYKIWQNINDIVVTSKNRQPNKELNENLQELTLSLQDKQLLFKELNLRGDLKTTEVLKLLKLKSKDWNCNFNTIQGNTTNQAIYNVLQAIAEDTGYGFDWAKKQAAEIRKELKAILPLIGMKPEVLDFDPNTKNYQQQLSYQLWHLIYATEDDVKINKEDEVIYGKNNIHLKKQLHQKFGIPIKYAELFVNIQLQNDYGNLSTKAIRKMMPFLQEGHQYYNAKKLAKYKDTSITKEENLKRELKDQLELITKNSLRNPVVEKILNQLVNVVNQIIKDYDKPDEIRIELARELKKSAKQRKELSSSIAEATRKNTEIKKILQKVPFNRKNPTKNDVVKYKLYKELATNGYKTLYSGKTISENQLFSKEIDIEHIIPKAKLYDDSYSNKTLAFRNVNLKKSDQTAIDFVKGNYDVENYVETIKTLYNNGKGSISKGKYLKLLMEEENLDNGFINRDLNNSQYIAKKAMSMLHQIVYNVTPTTGKITAKLREDWNLVNVMKELNLPKYKALGLTFIEERTNGNKVEKITNWSKRNDHRHHAMDALTVAFTTKSHIQYFNTDNAKDESVKKAEFVKNGSNKKVFKAPIDDFRKQAKTHIESVLISFKNKNKVTTQNKNKIKSGKTEVCKQQTLTPRGQLHKETVYGISKKEIVQKEKVNGAFDLDKINAVTKPLYKKALLKRFLAHNNDSKKAFTGQNSLSKNPIITEDGKKLPIEITTKIYETIYTIRKEITADNFKNVKAVEKVIDRKSRKLLLERLEQFKGNAKEAFANLDINPIWINKNKGIRLKRVTITGVSNAIALHDKKDHLGNLLLTTEGKTQPVDFVSTGNNHHVAIYLDEKGIIHDRVISFFEAVSRTNQNLPIIDKELNTNLGWKFLFTMKQNEFFVFPSEDFNPKEIDLLNKQNYSLISPYLFRVQKFSKLEYGNSAVRDYVFRHHLETQIIDHKNLKETTYITLKSTKRLNDIVKVRVNHIGQIVHIGEY